MKTVKCKICGAEFQSKGRTVCPECRAMAANNLVDK